MQRIKLCYTVSVSSPEKGNELNFICRIFLGINVKKTPGFAQSNGTVQVLHIHNRKFHIM